MTGQSTKRTPMAIPSLEWQLLWPISTVASGGAEAQPRLVAGFPNSVGHSKSATWIPVPRSTWLGGHTVSCLVTQGRTCTTRLPEILVFYRLQSNPQFGTLTLFGLHEWSIAFPFAFASQNSAYSRTYKLPGLKYDWRCRFEQQRWGGESVRWFVDPLFSNRKVPGTLRPSIYLHTKVKSTPTEVNRSIDIGINMAYSY